METKGALWYWQEHEVSMLKEGKHLGDLFMLSPHPVFVWLASILPHDFCMGNVAVGSICQPCS